MKKEKGKKFDPEILKVFIAIFPTITKIRRKFA
jgi:response regulator RpfG family c-di-GMP phosphodiesterase